MKVIKIAKTLAFAASAAGTLFISMPTPAIAATTYEECLQAHCWGNYTNDPAGYKACVAWCASTTGGPT